MSIANNGANYVLMQDLDAEGYYWEPIKSFKNGTFDGNNHMISNIVYKALDNGYQGLFASLSNSTTP